ncbi:hypothetical protein SCHPADRAFT_7814 [Schizopora paradoxa]|uniref:DUF6533 domain-containing protein n=1 Tax=Schizopora paradoxa TaxID=27342 RepID=A0A0H2S9H0_9AGAM|nr:hypothetical protein SCHPADRAFT_7814 [Schizopora paradoxa]
MASPDEGETSAAYIRVGCLAIGAYDYISTLSTEIAIYKSQYRARRISRQCALFILIRYVSIAAITMNGVGHFGQFSPDACSHLYLVAPLFKVLQALSSQLVLFHRTYSISQKSTKVGIGLCLMFLASVPALLFANIFKRQHALTPGNNCTSGNDSGTRIAWIHYVVCMIFDGVTTVIASTYLWRYTREFRQLRVYLRRLTYEGLGYFVLLTAVNILNIVIYRGDSVDNQSSGVSIGYIATWIMSQRVLLRQQGPVTVFVEDDVPSFDFANIRIDLERQPTASRSLVFAASSRTSTVGNDAETTKSNYDDLLKRTASTEGHLSKPVQVFIRKRSETVSSCP